MEKPRLGLLDTERLKHNSHPYDALMMHRKKKETRLPRRKDISKVYHSRLFF